MSTLAGRNVSEDNQPPPPPDYYSGAVPGDISYSQGETRDEWDVVIQIVVSSPPAPVTGSVSELENVSGEAIFSVTSEVKLHFIFK